MIDIMFFCVLLNLMFHLNKSIMKDLLFKKSLLLPFLLTGMFALFLSSCEKDKDGEGEGQSLDVTVNFTGSKTPAVGDVLNVVVLYTKISELDFNSEGVGPDFYVDVPLTQSDIDNGVTVKLDMIDLNKPEIYIGALVDMDDEPGPSPGDLIEFFDDVSIIDAVLGVAQPTNCHGKKSVVINLDKVMTLPSLDVTVNFTGDKTPEVGDELAVVVFYTKISELDFNDEEVGPDFFVEVPLTQSDIDNGITVKLYMNMIDLDAPEIYVAALVDMDDELGPSPGDLIEFFDDVSIFEAVSGEKEATNVAGKTEITINLDKVGLGRSLDVTVNFTGTTKPLPGQKLYVSLFYSPLTEVNMDIDGPDIMLSHILTADDIENGKTLTLSDIDPSATEVYVGAFVDTNNDGPGEGELIECYKDVSYVAAVNGEAEATNVVGETAITINLDMVLEMP